MAVDAELESSNQEIRTTPAATSETTGATTPSPPPSLYDGVSVASLSSSEDPLAEADSGDAGAAVSADEGVTTPEEGSTADALAAPLQLHLHALPKPATAASKEAFRQEIQRDSVECLTNTTLVAAADATTAEHRPLCSTVSSPGSSRTDDCTSACASSLIGPCNPCYNPSSRNTVTALLCKPLSYWRNAEGEPLSRRKVLSALQQQKTPPESPELRQQEQQPNQQQHCRGSAFDAPLNALETAAGTGGAGRSDLAGAAAYAPAETSAEQ
ncbi:hypothetical protein cyc_06471 [Cyclospora cayetanensis]|uniref:Uncharacterized protein n=1 Tax=Cyclospora cayetanensis TaxID=88456 RepID=A0A1D3D3G2_9EIME|nr:hypothetical protein cyc_06471 [Cyclospora cayetanensis]